VFTNLERILDWVGLKIQGLAMEQVIYLAAVYEGVNELQADLFPSS